MNNPFPNQKAMLHSQKQRTLFEEAKSYASEYLDDVLDRNVFPTENALENLNFFDEAIPDIPGDPAEMLRILHEYGSPATVASTGGRYFGMVIGSAFPPVMAAKWLATVWDQISALHVTSPISSKLESVCEKWLIDLLGLPENSVAGFVSGTSMATMCGLAAARYELLNRAGWDVINNGLFGAPPIRVVLGAEAHSTVYKALAMLGLGKERVETVPIDSQGRMIAEAVPNLDNNTLLILQAGNVNSGSFDPFDEICEKANQANAWVHIDGAFGLWAAASNQTKHFTYGIEKADSWSVDGHKTLNTPYDSGVILCKHAHALVSAMQATGAYILYGEHRDGMLYTPEMSARGRAIEIWATLKILGKSGVEELVNVLCTRAQQFAIEISAAGFQVLNDIDFNQVVVACPNPEQTTAILDHLQKSGECWCGAGNWHNTPVIRISVCSWATTAEDITRSVQAFIIAKRECSD
ncbi:MAG: aspartate aminotransferase family protein [Anaerolineaceae bacterium]|nr:aspartate aminotransferase family protein [Anaerolineaceae bacterium]